MVVIATPYISTPSYCTLATPYISTPWNRTHATPYIYLLHRTEHMLLHIYELRCTHLWSLPYNVELLFALTKPTHSTFQPLSRSNIYYSWAIARVR